jgi:hypothetical protein
MVPRSTMEKDLRNQEKGLTDDINSLGKKVTFLVLPGNLLRQWLSGQISGEAIQ